VGTHGSDEGSIGIDMRIAKNIVKTALLAGVLLPTSVRCAPVNAHCTGGVELKLSAPQASQGSLILAQVRSQKALREVTGKWNERNVYFWEGGSSAAARRGTINYQDQALLGVDLEKAPGDYELSVSAITENGEHAECTVRLAVRAGKFATESLTVQKQFVEPNEQQAQRAVAEQEKLRRIFDHITPEKLWHGRFRLPLTGGVRGTNFGKRRILNGQARSPHTGADFPAPTGTPIHATQSGRVVLAEELYFSGNTVIIDHGLGIYSLYGHLSATDVAVGDAVKAGAVIGKVGATGRVTGSHLHWGVTVNKARVNPIQLVDERLSLK
jgi:murein DD-endopeptidase MepM/ murein hydrolase activator NlpD